MAMMGMLSGIIGMVGSIAEGQANAAAAEYQAQVARNNAIVAEQNAVYELQAGQVEEQGQRIKTGQILADAEAAQSASGIDASRGTALASRHTTAKIGELDALNIRDNAARRAYGYRAEGVNFEAQAGLYEMEAKSARTAGLLGGLGQLVGGMSSMIGGGGSGGFGGMTASVAPKWGSMMSPAVGGTDNFNAFEPYGAPKNTLLQYTLPRY